MQLDQLDLVSDDASTLFRPLNDLELDSLLDHPDWPFSPQRQSERKSSITYDGVGVKNVNMKAASEDLCLCFWQYLYKMATIDRFKQYWANVRFRPRPLTDEEVYPEKEARYMPNKIAIDLTRSERAGSGFMYSESASGLGASSPSKISSLLRITESSEIEAGVEEIQWKCRLAGAWHASGVSSAIYHVRF